MAIQTYQAILKDHTGAQVAVFSGAGRSGAQGGLQSITYNRRLRTPGGLTIRILGNDDRIQDHLLLPAKLDYQWEIWRSDPDGGLEFYKDHEAFHRSEDIQQQTGGRSVYVSFGAGYNDLLASDTIRWAAGSAEASKSGDATTIALEYVAENIGVSAGIDVLGLSRVRPGLTVPANNPAILPPDPASRNNALSAKNWQGARANDLLIDVLQDLAEFTPADFNIVGSGAAQFEFLWRSGRWGRDRTTGNTEGNAPLRFSANLNNTFSINTSLSYLNEVNVVYALGAGQGELRNVQAAAAADRLALSPWARRAVGRNLTNMQSDQDLIDAAQALVIDNRGRRVGNFQVQQTAATRYGRDWDLGDLIEAENQYGEVFPLKIIGVTVTITKDGEEKISVQLEEEKSDA